MNRHPLTRLILPVMVIFFVLGFLSVLVTDSPSNLEASSTMSPPPLLDPIGPEPAVDPNPTSLLILGVDSLNASNPRLLAVWWATFSPSDHPINVVGIPLNAAPPMPDSRPVSEEFNFSPVTGPSQDFLDYLSTLSSANPEVVIVLDEYAFAALIDFMGGAWMDGSLFDGQSIVTAMQFLQDDPAKELALQASLLLTLSFQAEQLGDSPEITSLTSLVPDHAYISIPPTTLVNMIIPLLPIQSQNVQIHIWTPEFVLPPS